VEFVSGWQHAWNYISTHWADFTGGLGWIDGQKSPVFRHGKSGNPPRTASVHPHSGAARIVEQRGSGYGSIGGLEYEVPQSRLYCLCINVALCSTALQCICPVIRRSSMTMKAHTFYIIFGRPPIGGASPNILA